MEILNCMIGKFTKLIKRGKSKRIFKKSVVMDTKRIPLKKWLGF